MSETFISPLSEWTTDAAISHHLPIEAFSTASCLSAAAAQSSSSTRTWLFSPITSGFWLSSVHKGSANREPLEKSVVLTWKVPRTRFDGIFCVAFLHATQEVLTKIWYAVLEHLKQALFCSDECKFYHLLAGGHQVTFSCTFEEEFLQQFLKPPKSSLSLHIYSVCKCWFLSD